MTFSTGGIFFGDAPGGRDSLVDGDRAVTWWEPNAPFERTWYYAWERRTTGWRLVGRIAGRGLSAAWWLAGLDVGVYT